MTTRLPQWSRELAAAEIAAQLVDRDANERAAGLVRVARELLRADAVLFVVAVPGEVSHSPVAALEYDPPAIDYLASSAFIWDCRTTRRQLSDDRNLYDWNDVPQHADSHSVQSVLGPRGYRNGLTMPVLRHGQLVGACHVSVCRPRLLPLEKISLIRLRRAFSKVSETILARTVSELTRRELEILTQIRRGLSNQQIAEQLFLSPRTVSTHVEHILRKLGCRNRVGAAVWAEANQIDVEDRSIA